MKPQKQDKAIKSPSAKKADEGHEADSNPGIQVVSLQANAQPFDESQATHKDKLASSPKQASKAQKAQVDPMDLISRTEKLSIVSLADNARDSQLVEDSDQHEQSQKLKLGITGSKQASDGVARKKKTSHAHAEQMQSLQAEQIQVVNIEGTE